MPEVMLGIPVSCKAHFSIGDIGLPGHWRCQLLIGKAFYKLFFFRSGPLVYHHQAPKVHALFPGGSSTA